MIKTIDASAWGDWDEMLTHIKRLQHLRTKIKLINGSYLLELWHGEELEQLGFKKQYE